MSGSRRGRLRDGSDRDGRSRLRVARWLIARLPELCKAAGLAYPFWIGIGSRTFRGIAVIWATKFPPGRPFPLG